MMKSIRVIVACSLFLPFGAAFAADTPSATTSKPKSQASLECSKEADAKGLHGKERKAFRAKCKKEFKTKPQ
jgi:hypothetical protein